MSATLDVLASYGQRLYPQEKRKAWHAVAAMNIIMTLTLALGFLFIPNAITTSLITATSIFAKVPFIARFLPKVLTKATSSLVVQSDLVSTLFSLCGVLLLSMTLGWCFMTANDKPQNAFLFHCLMAVGYAFAGMNGGWLHSILLLFSAFNAIGAGLYFLTAGDKVKMVFRNAVKAVAGGGA